jgi:hypothetical protein
MNVLELNENADAQYDEFKKIIETILQAELITNDTIKNIDEYFDVLQENYEYLHHTNNAMMNESVLLLLTDVSRQHKLREK